MSKVSRNDPCPCQSGKKYKRCCIDKILSFPKKNDFNNEELKNPEQLLEMVKNEFEMREYNSLDEMNEKLSHLTRNYNEIPKASFLGISSSQMHGILNSYFCFENNLFSFKYPGNKKIEEIPLIKQSLYFLNKLCDAGELKATQKGNLPRPFVREFYYEFFSNERYARLPCSEDDLLGIVVVKNVLDISGFIKKRKNKFSLTKKGLLILEKSKRQDFFEEIVLTFINKWNWAYGDYYSDLLLIQRSAVFNFYLLNQKCRDWIRDDDLGQYYLDAFPLLVNQSLDHLGPEKEVIDCFTIRFIERICIPLGFIEVKEEGTSWLERKVFYRTTSLFEDYFESHLN